MDWTTLVAEKRKTSPSMAAALYRVTSSFLNHAEAEGWIAAPLLPRKGAAKLAPSPKARVRVLSDSELREVWRAVETDSPKARAFIRLLILTGARELEVADIATGEIDRTVGVWRLPSVRAKNGTSYTMPLSPLALNEIASVWPEHDWKAGPSWRLLGKIKGNGFRGFSKLKARVDAAIAAARAQEAAVTGAAASPMAPWRWHDLRRSVRTGMTRLGVSRDHAEAAINHRSGRTALERTYNRHDYAEEILAALNLWQSHVSVLIMPDVVMLSERRRARS
jgi:integrase